MGKPKALKASTVVFKWPDTGQTLGTAMSFNSITKLDADVAKALFVGHSHLIPDGSEQRLLLLDCREVRDMSKSWGKIMEIMPKFWERLHSATTIGSCRWGGWSYLYSVPEE